MPFKKIKQITAKSLSLLKPSSKKDKDKIREQYKKLVNYSGTLKRYREKIKFQYQRLNRYAKKIKSLEDKYNLLLTEHLLLTSVKNPYHSISKGNKKLENKWKKSSIKKRVLFVSPEDCSGSFMRWALALNKHSDYAVRMVTFERHLYEYDIDLVFPSINIKNWKRLLPLFDEADIIHVKDEMQLFSAMSKKDKITKDAELMKKILSNSTVKNKPKIFTHYGSYARKFQSDKNYRKLVKSFDARVAMTPDLNFDWFDGYFVPHAIDVDSFKYTWKDGNTITHSPSKPEKKGTDKFLEALEDKDLKDWNLDLIQGVSHKECIDRKQKASIFFDQFGSIKTESGEVPVGFYGNSALEAMVHGIPTIAHISKEAFEGAKRANKDWSNCPVLNPLPNNTKSIKEVILSFSGMSHKKRSELSKKTREWTEEHHSFQATAKDLTRIYDSLI